MSQTYNEEAFRYFLGVERRRSERAQTSFLLLLVSVRKEPGVSTRMLPVVAAGIFSGLWQSVREADFVGWFRDERVAGAVLTQGPHQPTDDVVAIISRRIIETLAEHVPSDVAGRLQVRVLQLRSRQER